MNIGNCRACGNPGTMRTAHNEQKMVYSVWIQCEKCGRQGISFFTGAEPTKTSDSAEVATMAWNNGIYQEDNKTCL